jgi:hypothetical protein
MSKPARGDQCQRLPGVVLAEEPRLAQPVADDPGLVVRLDREQEVPTRPQPAVEAREHRSVALARQVVEHVERGDRVERLDDLELGEIGARAGAR